MPRNRETSRGWHTFEDSHEETDYRNKRTHKSESQASAKQGSKDLPVEKDHDGTVKMHPEREDANTLETIFGSLKRETPLVYVKGIFLFSLFFFLSRTRSISPDFENLASRNC